MEQCEANRNTKNTYSVNSSEPDVDKSSLHHVPLPRQCQKTLNSINESEVLLKELFTQFYL